MPSDAVQITDGAKPVVDKDGRRLDQDTIDVDIQEDIDLTEAKLGRPVEAGQWSEKREQAAAQEEPFVWQVRMSLRHGLALALEEKGHCHKTVVRLRRGSLRAHQTPLPACVPACLPASECVYLSVAFISVPRPALPILGPLPPSSVEPAPSARQTRGGGGGGTGMQGGRVEDVAAGTLQQIDFASPPHLLRGHAGHLGSGPTDCHEEKLEGTLHPLCSAVMGHQYGLMATEAVQ